MLIENAEKYQITLKNRTFAPWLGKKWLARKIACKELLTIEKTFSFWDSKISLNFKPHNCKTTSATSINLGIRYNLTAF